MKTLKYIRVYIFLVLIILFIVLFWFRNGVFIYHDFSFPLYLEKFSNNIYLWAKSNNMGEYNVLNVGSASRDLLISTFSLPRNILTREILIFCFCFVYVALSSFKFFFELSERKFWTAFSITLFYVFNFFTMNRLYDGHIYLFVVYGSLPILIYLVDKYLALKQANKYLVSILLVVAFLGSGFSNIPMLLGSVVIPIVIYLIFLFSTKVDLISRISKLLKLIGFGVLISAFWIVPLVYYYVTSFKSSLISVDNQYGLTWPDIAWQHGGFVDLFKFSSHWLWGAKWAGDYWYYYYRIFQSSPLLIVCSMAFIAIAVVSILKINPETKRKNIVIYKSSLVMLGLSIFLANGTQGLFGRFWTFLYFNVPIFNIFRAPPTKFLGIAIFSVSVLMLLLLKQVSTSKRLYLFLIAILIGSTLIVSWPMISGNIFYRIPRGYWGTRVIKSIPKDYIDLARKINATRLYTNYYEYPFAHSGFFDFGGSNYEGEDILELLTKKTLISICSGFSTDCDFISAFQKDLSKKLVAFPLLNSRYILNRLDLFNYEDTEQLWKNNYQLSDAEISSEFIGERVSMYRLSDKYFLHLFE